MTSGGGNPQVLRGGDRSRAADEPRPVLGEPACDRLPCEARMCRRSRPAFRGACTLAGSKVTVAAGRTPAVTSLWFLSR